ncbi:hypothetical protein Vafri_12324, partial [Volvox africanus]
MEDSDMDDPSTIFAQFMSLMEHKIESCESSVLELKLAFRSELAASEARTQQYLRGIKNSLQQLETLRPLPEWQPDPPAAFLSSERQQSTPLMSLYPNPAPQSNINPTAAADIRRQYEAALSEWYADRTHAIRRFICNAKLDYPSEWFAQLDALNASPDDLTRVHEFMEAKGFPAPPKPQPPFHQPIGNPTPPPPPHYYTSGRPSALSPAMAFSTTTNSAVPTNNVAHLQASTKPRWGPCPVFSNDDKISVREWLRVMYDNAQVQGIAAHLPIEQRDLDIITWAQ